MTVVGIVGTDRSVADVHMPEVAESYAQIDTLCVAVGMMKTLA